MRLTIPEILQLVSNARTHQEKVAILRQHQSLPLEQVLQYNFHPAIKFSLPEGIPPYKKETDIPVGKSHTNLYQEGRRLYIFLDGYAPNLKPYKKEQLFIELLEGLHFTEAEVIVAIKDKRLTDLYPGVTYESAYEAFAQLIPHPSTRPAPVVSKKEVVTPVEVPLEQASVDPKVDQVIDQVKKRPKREMTPQWKASLERAAQARREKAAARRLEKQLEKEKNG